MKQNLFIYLFLWATCLKQGTMYRNFILFLGVILFQKFGFFIYFLGFKKNIEFYKMKFNPQPRTLKAQF